MPQVVDAYVQGKTYQEIDMVKRNILALYEEDLGKYLEIIAGMYMLSPLSRHFFPKITN